MMPWNRPATPHNGEAMNDVEMKQRLTADLDRRLDDVARRLDGAVTRAGIVIPTAIVIAALPHAGDSWIRSGFLLATFFLAGLVILYRDGPQVPVRRLALRAAEYSHETLDVELYETKLKILDHEEAAMNRRALQLTLAYGALIASVIFIVLPPVTP
jgi:hypothetical protein